MSRLTNDMDVISRLLTNNVAQLFTGILTLGGVIAIMFALNTLLALTSMIVFPLMIVLVATVGRRTRNSFRRFQARLGALNAVLEESFSGQRVVLAFGREQSILNQFDRTNEAARAAGVRAMAMALLVMPMMGILSNANVAILGGVGGWMAIRGMATIGTIAAFITYSRRFAEPLRQLGDIYNQVQAALNLPRLRERCALSTSASATRPGMPCCRTSACTLVAANASPWWAAPAQARPLWLIFCFVSMISIRGRLRSMASTSAA
jgi:ATP-binding cassette subfamily B multidrug efflux pump